MGGATKKFKAELILATFSPAVWVLWKSPSYGKEESRFF